MKELSIEEKACRYDEAIELAKAYQGHDVKCALEEIFPELKEGEDERIRKELIAHINRLIVCHDKPNAERDEKYESWIAWLEKQAQKQEWSEEDKNMLKWVIGYLENKMLNAPISEERTACKNAIAWLERQAQHIRFWESIQIGDKVTRNKDGMLVNLSQLDRVAKKDEKQGEQKHVPDWMPKFLDELRSKKNYFDFDEHKDIEGGILAIINWMNPNYFNEKDGKQKPADKVESKFHEGEWITIK